MTLYKHSLPSFWIRTKIGELISARVSQDGPGDKEAFFYVDIGSIDRCTKSILLGAAIRSSKAPSRAKQKLSPGDVLVSMTRPNLNAVALVPSELDDAIGSTAFHVLRPVGAVSRWLYYLVQTEDFIRYLCGKVQGVLYPAVRPKDIDTYDVDLPPAKEQDRIVAALDEHLSELDAAVASLNQAERNLSRYRAAVLAAACSGKLVPTEAELAKREGRSYESADKLLERILAERRKASTKTKYMEPVKPDTSKLPKLPEGWEWTSLDQILAEPLSNGRSVPDALEGFPVLRLTAIRKGIIDLREHKIGLWTADKARPFLVQAGDILLSRGNGTLALVGRGGVVPDDPIRVAFPDTMIRVRRASSVNREYLAMLWNSPVVRTQIEKTARTTAGIYKVNQEILESIHLPLPPAEEQVRIADEVERHMTRADALAASITQTKRRAQRLRRSILTAAFHGRLVPQDPKDEPASVLLDRIRALAAEADSIPAGRHGRPSGRAMAAVAHAADGAIFAPKRRGRPPGAKNRAK